MLGRTPNGWLWESRSADNGTTWSMPVKTAVPNPVAPPVLTRVPGTDTLVLIQNPDVDMKSGWHGGPRRALAFRTSTDGGRTWSKPTDLYRSAEEGLWVDYPAIRWIDGNLHMVWRHNYRAATPQNMTSLYHLTVPAAVALVAIALPLTTVLFQRGAFGADDAANTALALAASGAGFAIVLRSFAQAELQSGRLVTPFDGALVIDDTHYLLLPEGRKRPRPEVLMFCAWLRAQAGEVLPAQGFIELWLHRLLFFQAPGWVFALADTLFGLAVAATWWRWPPRRR
jgi:hypothetical protein